MKIRLRSSWSYRTHKKTSLIDLARPRKNAKMETPTALARNLEVGLFGNKLRFQKSTSGSLREQF
jgi:hypothetical protein